MDASAETWKSGDRVFVRGQTWTILEHTTFARCELLRLASVGAGRHPDVRTLLTPFDRPHRVQRSSSIAVLRPRRWLHTVRRAAARGHPVGGLTVAAQSDVALLPYQLEPALAMIRMGIPRVMIADGVGLGKTIQAGFIVGELAAQRESFRALIVGPAGLREQWSCELASRFHLPAKVAGSVWLQRVSRELPRDVNPWILPGVYVSSFDFLKRPEVLRPLEEVEWDIVVIDEAHGAALGTARRAAVHAVAIRSRRVLLLTATPHAGDPEQFDALCRIGAHDGDATRVMLFRRTRSDAGAATTRRTVLLPVRPADAERRLHRLLDDYTARVCREAGARGDARARLAVIVLKKRALSSAASLAASARRRLALLSVAAPSDTAFQLELPLGDEDVLEDAVPDSILAAPGLADGARERRWLGEIVEAALNASRAESKIRFLLRLLRRMREPVIVFTEYRDTLERLERAVAAEGHDVQLLHGAVPAAERSAVQRRFNERGGVLLATDAASEGLNLQRRCRAVVHYELPWSPARLEQRTGRVDRIGQDRRVHEILLVAGDTAERLVLAPLARRAGRASATAPSSARLWDLLSESRVAAAVMDGERLCADAGAGTPAAGLGRSAAAGRAGTQMSHAELAPAAWHDEAVLEVQRLQKQRAWIAASGSRTPPGGPVATIVRLRRSILQSGFFCVYTISLSTQAGDEVHREVVTVRDPFASGRVTSTAADARDRVEAFIDTSEPALRAMVLAANAPALRRAAATHNAAVEALEQRERTMAITAPSAARQLVQAGLFDRRAIRAQEDSRRAAGSLLEACEERLEALTRAKQLTTTVELTAILIACRGAR